MKLSTEHSVNKLNNRWALVTGSSRGIGREIALGLARLGCNIVVHGREAEHVQEALQLLDGLPVQKCSVSGRLDSVEGVRQIVDGVQQSIAPRIDILYNNAAINNTPTPLFEFSPETWLETFQVNLFSMVQLCNAFAPAMRENRWGRIINLTSGIANQPQLAPYSASKAAVDKFTRDLAWELKDDNVLVNHVDPGWIRTDLGGPDAWEDVSSVIPGVLVPALLEDGGATGKFFAAQDYKGLTVG